MTSSSPQHRTRTHHRLLGIAALSATLLALTAQTLATPAQAASSDYAKPVAHAAPALPSASARAAGALEPTGYWTEEKMRNAVDADVLQDASQARTSATKMPTNPATGPKTTTPAAGPTVTTPQTRALPSRPVPMTVGKLFYYNPYVKGGQNQVCTAAAVNTAKKNTVATAAHCIYEAKKGWMTNVVFAPAYFDGPSYLGVYNYENIVTSTAWINDKNWDYDQAFVAFNPRAGTELVNAVGGNGMSYNYPQAQPFVRLWGYPVEKGTKYEGATRPFYCEDNSAKGPYQQDAQVDCDMTGGASGGPWLRQVTSVDLGSIYAVTSRRLPVVSVMYAAPFTSATKELLTIL